MKTNHHYKANNVEWFLFFFKVKKQSNLNPNFSLLDITPSPLIPHTSHSLTPLMSLK